MTRLRNLLSRRLLLSIVVSTLSLPAWAQFETRAIGALPQGAWSIATGDFNGNGNLDVVVMDDGGFSVSLGNGDGTFQTPVFYATSAVSYSLAVADFNNDSKLDIVVANDNSNPSTVSVYLGNGDGTFQAPITSNTTSPSSFVAVGDFNGDHKMDIVIVDHTYVSVLLGNGDGTFQAPIDNSSFADEPVSLAVGDFNNDGVLDVAVIGSFGESSDIGVLLGNGNGTLQASLNYSLTYEPVYVSAADLNDDGNLDAVVTDYLGGVSVLLGNGVGSFQSETLYNTTGESGGEVMIGDFKLDGDLDLALEALSGKAGGVDVFWGNGDGTFQAAQFFGTGESGYPVLGDFNNDHLPDFALANEFWLTGVLNTGVAGFSPSAPLAFPVRLVGTSSPSQIVALTNLGTTSLSINSFKVSGDFHASNGCGTSVAVGAKCDIKVLFKPTVTGPLQGLITIKDSASSKPQVIELSGTGTEVDLSPNPMKFASQKVGTQSAPQKLTIKNDSSTDVTFSDIGAKTHDFVITGTENCTSKPLAPGASCYVTVTFTPIKTGTRTATLYVTDSDAGSPQIATLTGTGN